jgi:hypothetical protein
VCGGAGGGRGPGRVTGKEQKIGGQTWTGPGGRRRMVDGFDGTDAPGQQRPEGCLSVSWVRSRDGSGAAQPVRFAGLVGLKVLFVDLL